MRSYPSFRGFTLIEILVVIGIIGVLIGLLIPALGAAQRQARRMQSGNQARNIHQAMLRFADGNGQFFPGVNDKGVFVTKQTDSTIDSTGPNPIGATVQGRYELLLDGEFLTPETLISPLDENKIEWGVNPNDEDEGIEPENISFAMLELGVRSSGGASELEREPRSEEWRSTGNARALVLSDRNTGSNDTGNVSSIHTTIDSGDWEGSVQWNDGHVTWEQTHLLEVKYGSGELLTGDDADNIFDDDSTQGSKRQGADMIEFDLED